MTHNESQEVQMQCSCIDIFQFLSSRFCGKLFHFSSYCHFFQESTRILLDSGAIISIEMENVKIISKKPKIKVIL